MPAINQQIAIRLEAHTCHLSSPSKRLSLHDFTLGSLTGGWDRAVTTLTTWLNLQATLLGFLTSTGQHFSHPCPALPSYDFITLPLWVPISDTPSVPAV